MILCLIGALSCAMLVLARPVAAPGSEGARIALVIGNKSYAPEVGPLKNPLNDIDTVGQALQQLGFEVVFVRNADFGTMQKAVKRHASRLQQAGDGAVGFFYYSGHGAMNEATRTNYLIPVDVVNTDTAELWDNSIRLETIIAELRDRASNATNFIVFDGCRNNLKLAAPGGKAVIQSKGFKAERVVRGMLIAYATAEGEIASDIGEAAGPYASTLAEEIQKGGVEAVSMFRRVQLRVTSLAQQEPWLTYGTLPEIYLAGRDTAPVPPGPTVRPPLSEAAQSWATIKDSEDLRDFEAFRKQYGSDNPFYDRQAEKIIALLSKPSAAPTAAQATGSEKTCKGVMVPLATGEKQCLSPGSGQSYQDCPTCPEMVVIPSGRFTMGSPDNEEGRQKDEGPQHSVTIPSPFAVGKFEVTFAEWDACVAEGGCQHMPGYEGWGRDSRPVINVSWDDAKAYVGWLSKSTGHTYRLLSEAEWEYAARAGTKTPFWWGNSISTDQANYDGNGTYGGGIEGEYRAQTVPVDSMKPNPWGLHHVHGNVWEWVEDCYEDSYAGAPVNGSVKTSGNCSFRVVRGGSWNYDPRVLRSAYRYGNHPVGRDDSIGFRVSRTLTP